MSTSTLSLGQLANAVPFSAISELKGPINVDSNIFIRNRSYGITPIWYRYDVQSRHWYWTPYSDLRCWIPVEILSVPTGHWKGCQPAVPNIVIIRYLAENRPIPPHIYELSKKRKENKITNNLRIKDITNL